MQLETKGKPDERSQRQSGRERNTFDMTYSEIVANRQRQVAQ